MAQASIEFYSACLDCVDDVVFADKTRASFHSLRSCRGVGGTEEGDADGRVDRVGETQPVPDGGTILGCAKANEELVFRRCRRLTDLEGSNVAMTVRIRS